MPRRKSTPENKIRDTEENKQQPIKSDNDLNEISSPEIENEADKNESVISAENADTMVDDASKAEDSDNTLVITKEEFAAVGVDESALQETDTLEPDAQPPQQTPPLAPQIKPLSSSEEYTWAMIAHLSVLANLVTGFLGPLIALVIYMVFQNRSRYVAYQSMQAFVFQLIWWIGGGVLAALAWTISGLLAVIVVGCCLMPFALLISLIPLASLIYGVYGAIQTSQGQDFRYWLIGDWLRSIYKSA